MKPTRKQLDNLKGEIRKMRGENGLSDAEIGRISGVHPSQVGRICGGEFKTFSYNVMQVCKVLDVSVPRHQPRSSAVDPEWALALASMSKLWDETPEGAKIIARMLEAIAELQSSRKRKTSRGQS